MTCKELCQKIDKREFKEAIEFVKDAIEFNGIVTYNDVMTYIFELINCNDLTDANYIWDKLREMDADYYIYNFDLSVPKPIRNKDELKNFIKKLMKEA